MSPAALPWKTICHYPLNRRRGGPQIK